MENIDDFNDEGLDRPLIIIKKGQKSESFITSRQGGDTSRKYNYL